MFKKLFGKLVGDPNQRQLDRYQSTVDQINALEPEMQARTGEQLRDLTRTFQQRLREVSGTYEEQIEELRLERDLEQNADRRRELGREIEDLQTDRDDEERAALEEILPQAFAAVREASVRTTGMRHFDVQLIGGLVLHNNTIAEMKTGEGKTLVATLPLYLNGLTGRGAHLVTPNDYLSKVGAQWMGPIYDLLGLSVGVIQSMGQNPEMSSFIFDPDYAAADDRYQHLRPCTRQDAYAADITYGTNNEFGFDYLRDNMVHDLNQCVQRELYYAIVDEVDNILIDEARTPLIISGQAEESTGEYQRMATVMGRLREEDDYAVDEKLRSVSLTEEGITKVERALGVDNLYSPEHYNLTPYVENALKAHALFTKDRDYVVVDGEVIIIDEFTGRMMYGRRYSDGLHQAIEAKEKVKVQRESLTLATITFQNFFRMYRRLAGMTGTAATEGEEFAQIYDLEVLVIPTHKPIRRNDLPDSIYKTGESKFRAIFQEIQERHAQNQPILLGTLAIETSEMISQKLHRMRIPHEVLNAKQHEREAQIIAQAGQPGAVTIATNMAGRGVDILLGGNPEALAREKLRKQGKPLEEIEPELWEQSLQEAEETCAHDKETVLQAGGLHVIGTERYEARRIDNQLRGRSGRQGDVGSSRFFVALDDELMRRFGGPSVARIMERLGVDEDIPIEHSMVTKAIESAQVRVEGHNFDLRKHILEYDDVVNQQRQVIYDQRRLVLTETNLKPVVMEILEDQIRAHVNAYAQALELAQDLTPKEEAETARAALRTLHDRMQLMIHLPEAHTVATWDGMDPDEIAEQALTLADKSYEQRKTDLNPEMMQRIDRWVMLTAIDNLWNRHLTALDQLREGIGLRAFGQRNPLIEYKREAFDAFEMLLENIKALVADRILNVQVQSAPQHRQPVRYSGASGGSAGSTSSGPQRSKKVGRNEPCPCGSGKKFKNCCMREGLSAEEAAAKGAKSQR